MAEDSTERKPTIKDAGPVSGSVRRYDGLLRYLSARLYEERDRPRRDDSASEEERKR